MLGLIDHVLVEVEPILTPGEFQLRATKLDSSGQGHLFLYHGAQVVQTGRTFYCMAKEGEVILSHNNGKFSLGRGAKATFRCVFAGQHLDINCERK